MRRFAPLFLLACAQAAPAPARGEAAIDLYAAGESPHVLLGDVDGDRHADMVIAYGSPSTDRGIALRLGDGHGGFGEPRRILFGTASAVLYDLDADGRDDVFVDDGQNLGVLYAGSGPMVVLGRPNEPSVLHVDARGILTTDGASALTLHAWAEEPRAIEVVPLTPVGVVDADGDGAADLAGLALGHAAVRTWTKDGFSPVRLLGPAAHVTVADGAIIGWSGTTATVWRNMAIASTLTIPRGTVAIAMSARDAFAATTSRLWRLSPYEDEIPGPWTGIQDLAIDGDRLIVVDPGAHVIAVVHPP
jgi:hypothetical protein